jgi:nicotinate phosphoribosyltransferase
MHVLERLITEVPDNILGTSNLFMADYFGIPAMGTSAHEMDMVYAALAGDDDEALYNAHPQMMDHWMERYGPRYATGLTDTFGAKYFFDSLGPERARTWGKYRQDSGDPFLFGDYALRRLREYDVDPEDKLITWSDGLDIPLSVKLLGEFRDETNPNFGIGTDLTCDLGLDALFGVKALNIVMKATHVNGRPTVKLSDVATKHTGPTDEVERYKRVFNYVPLSDAVKLG